MPTKPTQTEFIEALAKHLPPSASDLQLLDIGGMTRDTLCDLRADIQPRTVSLLAEHWSIETNSVDAVVGYDMLLKTDMLAVILSALRPGGRFIVVNPLSEVDESYVKTLEDAGYIRILVEPAVGATGVLIRGEKPHTTADTLKRVEQVAQRDGNLLDLATYRGRYIHLLVVQTPNKPVWKLTPNEKIEWRAAAILDETEASNTQEQTTILLAFSSLPKAVNFMQPAVLQGIVQDVNKVGKFSKATAQAWVHPVLLNPKLENIVGRSLTWVTIDPDTAEAPDE